MKIPKKKLSDEQLVKIIIFAIKENRTLLPSQTMPDSAFPYYMEGKLAGYGLAIRKAKDRDAMQDDLAEMLAIILKLKEARKQAADRAAKNAAADRLEVKQ